MFDILLYFRMKPGESYFDRLPQPVNDAAVNYNKPCSCYKQDMNGKPICLQDFPMHFYNVMRQPGRTINLTPGDGFDREKRNVKLSDDLTEEDFDLFKRSVASGVPKRHKRGLAVKAKLSKENATRYCREKILESNVGKLCAKLGTNVQALVNSCSIDVEVKCSWYLLLSRVLAAVSWRHLISTLSNDNAVAQI